MNKDIRKKRYELLIKSKNLRELSTMQKYEKRKKLRDKQDEIYKKYKFYDNIIKSMEKNNER